MKFSNVAGLAAFAVSGAQAADSEAVDFLTKLVSDYDDNKKQYLSFFHTASNVPEILTSIARNIPTYTDDSYTTLLDNSGVDVSSLMSYATNLPWYERIEGGSKSGSGSSSGSSSKASSSSAGGAGSVVMAPLGAVAGAVALVLL
ncbi:putative beta-1,6-N-acetylglucosaminyltransferase [Candidozyma auris]|nr:hypothetical_protein [[Candida] auris]KND97823.1 hypothetical protein QG37_06238 [[Candida] auris]PIS54780.1 hypothetical protein B9J08_002560 [[Candida] auris]PIS55406.1 hypothetical protein CJI97_002105 [[Candida] auris]PSK77094.1 hypothetical protein CJJ07_003061 [[Candida] auris]QEL63451.1 hypothetical protein CJJ09_005653 [[Candida] auris]